MLHDKGTKGEQDIDKTKACRRNEADAGKPLAHVHCSLYTYVILAPAKILLIDYNNSNVKNYATNLRFPLV